MVGQRVVTGNGWLVDIGCWMIAGGRQWMDMGSWMMIEWWMVNRWMVVGGWKEDGGQWEG